MVKYRTVDVEGIDVFYREAGDPANPTLLLLHGFPTSSHMFRNLIPTLADEFHLVAPDYPGYGNSEFPPREEFDYTFDHLAEVVEGFIDALGLEKFSLYIQDYGAPIGLRIATASPERVEALIVQSGNAYEEGLVMPFWEPIFAYAEERTPENEAALRWQYTHGARDTGEISPDNWNLDQRFLDRPGNKEVQLDLFYDYQFNIPKYPAFQEYFRTHQPPTLITWGKNDEIFGTTGAEAYKRDLPDAELHLLDTGHFALEDAVVVYWRLGTLGDSLASISPKNGLLGTVTLGPPDPEAIGRMGTALRLLAALEVRRATPSASSWRKKEQ